MGEISRLPKDSVCSSFITSVGDACDAASGHTNASSKNALHETNGQRFRKRSRCAKGKAGESATHQRDKENCTLAMSVCHRRLREES